MTKSILDNERELLYKFSNKLVNQGLRKADLYDGANKVRDLDKVMLSVTEELGEVASAINRDRWELAKTECIDLAHCAFLVWLVLNRQENE